ncbi:MAG: hypothetical protein FJ215_10765 [Ignavibacteria bacterium]|nr:hypothetical protein [Ignavibacteria bacterium]
MQINVLNRGFELLSPLQQLNDYRAFHEATAMFNPILGPVRSLCFQFDAAWGMPLYCGTGYHGDIQKLSKKKISLSIVPAAGKGRRLSNAFAGTLGEAIERILPLLSEKFLRGRIIGGTPRELEQQGLNIVGPDSLKLFAQEQFRDQQMFYKPFTPETYVGWIDGQNILTGETVYAPAQFVVFGYKPFKKETPICYSSSGGLTSHVTMELARYHGLCEFIERDQLNIGWVCGFPPKRVLFTPEDLERHHLPLDQFYLFKNPHVDMRIYHWTVDIPGFHAVSVHCVLKDFRRLKYLPGVGADVTFSGALQKAVAEVAQAEKTFFFIAIPRAGEMPPMMEIDPDAEYDEITDLFKTIAYYGYDRNLQKVEEFYEGSKEVSVGDLEDGRTFHDFPSKHQRLLEIFRERKLTPICFDLTPPYFRNLKIQRSIVPELSTYFMIPRFLGHPRFYHLGKQVGLRESSLTFEELRTSSIPFP